MKHAVSVEGDGVGVVRAVHERARGIGLEPDGFLGRRVEGQDDHVMTLDLRRRVRVQGVGEVPPGVTAGVENAVLVVEGEVGQCVGVDGAVRPGPQDLFHPGRCLFVRHI